MIDNTIKIVIGSWGSYNACNEKALGSKWLNLSDYTTWEEITDELKREGFDLNGIDEELFIQDIEGIMSDSANWDYISPKTLFETLYESGVLNDEYKYEVMNAYLEICNFDEFEELVNNKGDRWDEDIYLYKDYDWEDYGRAVFEDCGFDAEVPEELQDFFNFESYGRSHGECVAHEYSGGLIEIFR